MNTQRVSIGEDAAIELYDTGWCKTKTSYEIVRFQLFTKELSVPFDVFQGALEKCLGRPVWTHEFGLNYDGLVKEFLGECKAPSMEEIINLIPEEKRLIIKVSK